MRCSSPADRHCSMAPPRAACWSPSRARPVPVYFIGVGEKLEDLQTFDAREFARALPTDRPRLSDDGSGRSGASRRTARWAPAPSPPRRSRRRPSPGASATGINGTGIVDVQRGRRRGGGTWDGPASRLRIIATSGKGILPPAQQPDARRLQQARLALVAFAAAFADAGASCIHHRQHAGPGIAQQQVGAQAGGLLQPDLLRSVDLSGSA